MTSTTEFNSPGQVRRLALDLPLTTPVEHLDRIRSRVDEAVRTELRSIEQPDLYALVWNTTVYSFTNETLVPFHLEDGEDSSIAATVEPGATIPASFVLPWCNRSYEVKTKAVRVYRGQDSSAPLVSYLFQDYESARVSWMRAPLQPGAYTYAPEGVFAKPAPGVHIQIIDLGGDFAGTAVPPSSQFSTNH
jgi:hypothetical protein